MIKLCHRYNCLVKKPGSGWWWVLTCDGAATLAPSPHRGHGRWCSPLGSHLAPVSPSQPAPATTSAVLQSKYLHARKEKIFTGREKIFTGLAKIICRWCAQFSCSDIDASGPEWHHHHSAIGARMGVLDTWVVATVIAAHVPASVGKYSTETRVTRK